MTTPSHELGAIPRYNSRLIERKKGLLLASPPVGVGVLLIGTGLSAGIEIKEGRGAIIIYELKLGALLPWGAGHNNLEGLKLDDHHGGGCDWTSETNKFRVLRLRHAVHRILGFKYFRFRSLIYSIYPAWQMATAIFRLRRPEVLCLIEIPGPLTLFRRHCLKLWFTDFCYVARVLLRGT
jgi:hypothetical protein